MVEPLRIKGIPEHILEWNAAKMSNLQMKNAPERMRLEDLMAREGLRSAQTSNELSSIGLATAKDEYVDRPRKKKFQQIGEDLSLQKALVESTATVLPMLDSPQKYNAHVKKLSERYGVDLKPMMLDESVTPEQYSLFSQNLQSGIQSELAAIQARTQGQMDVENLRSRNDMSLENLRTEGDMKILQERNRLDGDGTGGRYGTEVGSFKEINEMLNSGNPKTVKMGETLLQAWKKKYGLEQKVMSFRDEIEIAKTLTEEENKKIDTDRSLTPEQRAAAKKAVPGIVKQQIAEMKGMSTTAQPSGAKGSSYTTESFIKGLINGTIDPNSEETNAAFDLLPEEQKNKVVDELKRAGKI